jgi:hypothetical protein
VAVDTLGQLSAVMITPASEQDQAQIGELAERIQEATDGAVGVTFLDQGHSDGQPAADAQTTAGQLELVILPTATRALCCCLGIGLSSVPPWIPEAPMARFNRPARDYYGQTGTLVGLNSARSRC